MSFIKSIFICLMTIIQVSTFAAFAKVVSVKGKVSQLAPGAVKASWIKKGQLLKEDTSIVTRLRSFVKVEILADGSYIVVGPNSKIELTKIEKKSGSIIQLLNGKMRSNIVPAKKNVTGHKDVNKIYVKTKTMALGVRGTEFVTVVSQENQATSVVTLKGEVAVRKINQEDVDVEKTVKDSLDRDDVTIVKKGNASTTYAHLYEEIPPQKVNPNQLIALEKNETLQTVAVKDTQKANDTELNEKQLKELYGTDVREGDVPNNGAIVDLDSAIFIPEIKDSSLNVGSVDKNTGQFIASNEVKLDKKKGFVPVKKNDEDAKELAKKLNTKIEYKEVKGHEVVDHSPTYRGSNLSSLDNTWGASFGIAAKRMAYYSMDNNNSSNEYIGIGLSASGSYRHVLSQALYLKYFLTLDTAYMDRDKSSPDDKDDEFISPSLGAMAYYRVNNQMRLITGYTLGTDFFLLGRLENSLDPVVDQVHQFAPYITFGAEYDYSDNWSYKAAYRSYFPSSDDPKIRIYTGKGFELGARRRLSSSNSILFNILQREYLVQDVIVKNIDFNINYEMEF